MKDREFSDNMKMKNKVELSQGDTFHFTNEPRSFFLKKKSKEKGKSTRKKGMLAPSGSGTQQRTKITKSDPQVDNKVGIPCHLRCSQ